MDVSPSAYGKCSVTKDVPIPWNAPYPTLTWSASLKLQEPHKWGFRVAYDSINESDSSE